MSKTIASLLVLVAGLVGVGDIFPESEISQFVNATAQIIGIIGVWYGRISHGDVNWFGVRKG